MPNVTIDNKDYDLDKLPAEAKAQLQMILAADAKLAELQRDVAIVQTARNAYARALQDLLPKSAS